MHIKPVRSRGRPSRTRSATAFIHSEYQQEIAWKRFRRFTEGIPTVHLVLGLTFLVFLLTIRKAAWRNSSRTEPMRAISARISPMNLDILRQALETLKTRYDRPEALARDPLSRVLTYEDAWDREVAAWLAAHLAYGRVDPMLRAIDRILKPLGDRPSRFLRDRPASMLRNELMGLLGSWVWRFHTKEDLCEWLLVWKTLDAESRKGLEPYLSLHEPEAGLMDLILRLRKELPSTPGLRFNLPDSGRSAAKRWRLFLKWMVREEWPDLGQWKKMSQKDLFLPLDVHLGRLGRRLGLLTRASQDRKATLEITQTFRQICPEDPLRYDFALSHLGILGDCTAERGDCAVCPLWPVCSAFQMGKEPSPGFMKRP